MPSRYTIVIHLSKWIESNRILEKENPPCLATLTPLGRGRNKLIHSEPDMSLSGTASAMYSSDPSSAVPSCTGIPDIAARRIGVTSKRYGILSPMHLKWRLAKRTWSVYQNSSFKRAVRYLGNFNEFFHILMYNIAWYRLAYLRPIRWQVLVAVLSQVISQFSAMFGEHINNRGFDKPKRAVQWLG